MKSSRSLSPSTPIATLLLAAAITATGAVNITSPPTPDPFLAVPAVTDWSTMSVGAGVDAGITTPEDFDAKIIAALEAEATLITTMLGSSDTFNATTGPSINAIARFNTGVNSPGNVTFLQTRPTTVDYLLLLATLSNATGGDLNSVRVAYDYSKFAEAAAASETIKGLRAYWSVTGTAGSWQLIPSLSKDTLSPVESPEPVSGNITLPSPLANGGTMYILWADQNSNGADASYHIKNFSAGPGINCSIAAAPSGVQRNPGASAADPLDDTVSFSVTVTGTGTLSPAGWSVVSPASLASSTGTYNNPRAFPNVPLSEFVGGRLQITVRDAAEALCQSVTSVESPRLIGTNAAAGNVPIYSTGPVPATWVVDETARTLTMTAGGGADSIVVADLNLSAIGAVSFSATLSTADTSVGSNFETGDRFKAELVIDGVTRNLVSAGDSGNGDSAVLNTGLNGSPNGYLNGYTGAAGTDVVDGTVYAAGIDDYDANRERDEFNVALQASADLIAATFPLSFDIPASANSVQIRIYGAGFSGTETVIVSNIVVGAPAPADSDQDGVSDADEAIMGTNPNDPNDVLRLTYAGTPNTYNFPTETGRFYKVYASINMAGWANPGFPTIVGDGNPAQINLSSLPSVVHGFVRLHVMQTDGPWQ